MGSVHSRAVSQNGSMSPPDAYIPIKERQQRIKKEKELAEAYSGSNYNVAVPTSIPGGQIQSNNGIVPCISADSIG